MTDQMYAQAPVQAPTQGVVATDIPTRHKAGIWGGGITAIIALIIAIVALVLVFTYHSESWNMWRFTTVTPASNTASVTPNNRTLFQIAPGAVNTVVTVSISSGGKQGDLFGIGNTGKGAVGNLVVNTDAGGIIIPPSAAVQFIVTSLGVAPFSTQPYVLSQINIP